MNDECLNIAQITFLYTLTSNTSSRHKAECWGTWDTTCGHTAKDISPSIAWRRGVERGNARRSSLKGRDRAIVNQTNLEPFQKQHWGNFWETGWSAYGLFREHKYHLELNWTNTRGLVWLCLSIRADSSAEDKGQVTTRATGGEVTEEGVAEGPDSDPWMTCSVRTESLIVRLSSTEVKQLDSTKPFSLFPKAVSCPMWL